MLLSGTVLSELSSASVFVDWSNRDGVSRGVSCAAVVICPTWWQWLWSFVSLCCV